MKYIPSGVCSRTIEFEIENGLISEVNFIGGCRGNLQGIARLSIGRKPEEVIALLEGVQCRGNTSCPDQFAKALKKYLSETFIGISFHVDSPLNRADSNPLYKKLLKKW